MRLVPLVLAAALLVAAAAGVSVAPAAPSQADTRAHLLLVPDTAAGAAALARTDARTVARYGSFALVEAAGDDATRLRRAGADRRDDMRSVTTAAGAIDPAADRASLAAKDAPDRERVLALVQFVGPPKPAWLQRVRATGARLLSYQAQNAYVVHARGSAVGRLAALQGTDPAVRAVSVVTAADKLVDRSSPTGVFAVTTVAGAAGASAREDAAGAPIAVGALRTVDIKLSGAEAARLAADPGVVAIQAQAPPQLDDERSAQIVAGNLAGPALTLPAEPPAYRDWLVGRGIPAETFDFAIDITDSGLDNGADPPAHPDFYEGGSTAQPDRLAYATNYTPDSNARDCVGHGTNVAAIAAGATARTGVPEFEDGQGFDHGTGVAPFARIGVSKIADCAGAFASFNLRSLAASAYAAGARISNNSWGASTQGRYTAGSALFDALVRDASPDPGQQPLVEIFSAGNEGDGGSPSIGSNSASKNGIAVGAAESVRASGTDGCGVTDAEANSARDVLSWSSRGTTDGRRKPDLVAPGTHIVGAAPQHAGYTGAGTCTKLLAGTAWYSVVSGSSQAAPHVAGAAAIVRRWYQRQYGSPPSPALTKALLVNTATDLAGGRNGEGGTIAPGPNEDQGWGRVNIGSVLDGTQRDLRDQTAADTLHSGEQRLRAYTVHDTTKPVKVTMAFTDAPGLTASDPVVNDLDLVVGTGGRTYKGNVFDDAFSARGGAADSRNNVESVYLPAGTAGRFAVKVVGTNVAGDGVPENNSLTDQDFALVVSNADPSPAPVLVHDATTVDASITAGGDGDGNLEPGERFALDARVANLGDAGASGVSGTLAAGPALAISQAASAWPDLASGEAKPNVTRFTATVASDAPCGADIAATLSLTTAAGAETMPLTLPTGTPAAAASLTRAHSPELAIPDDSAAGAASTIDVATPGLIKDVDVRVTRLLHPAVGDLQIEIVAPDGTVVTLADRPGGADNDGDDMLATVFDDEAVRNVSSGTAPYTGRFRPQNDQLARFDGKQRQGTWTLRVRDLAAGDTGTLGEWGTDTGSASCSLAAVTKLMSGPVEGSAVTSRGASFEFGSDLAGATFQCRLNTESFRTCTSPRRFGGLPDGTHAFEVRAIVGGVPDPTPERRTWTIDATAPDSTITDGPSGRVGSATASVGFEAAEGTFECSLDGAAFAACTSPQAYAGLGEGAHTFAVRARDVLGNAEDPPTTRDWTVDTTAPAPTITASVDGATIAGTAGTATGDAETVTVRISDASGVVRTLTAPREAGGAWTVGVTPALPPGDYSVRAEQGDAAVPANVGRSVDVTFQIAAPPDTPDPGPPIPDPFPLPGPLRVPGPAPAPPSFLIAPAEDRPGRVTVLAACATACEVNAQLSRLGKGRAALATAGTAAVRIRLTARGRTALRRRAAVRTRLRVTLNAGGQTLTLKRPVAIRRAAGLRRIAARGLRLWGACSADCALAATLSVSGAGVADGAATATAGATVPLTLRVRPDAKTALKKARRVRAVLAAAAGTRTATQAMTLRR